MNDAAPPIEITFRIPGNWAHPGELIQRLPAGCRLTPEKFVMPDGTNIEFNPLPPDEQFAEIFRSSCRRRPTDDEIAAIEGYTVNVCLTGPGGSMQSAHKMMQAAALIVEAGGAGVFIDNSALSHGGQFWRQMAEMGDAEALSFAFVSIVRGVAEVWTMGMHTLGLRDIIMKRADADAQESAIIDIIRYLCEGEKPVENGHVIADLEGPRFQAFVQESPETPEGSPMFNPFGRLKLVSMRDLGETN